MHAHRSPCSVIVQVHQRAGVALQFAGIHESARIPHPKVHVRRAAAPLPGLVGRTAASGRGLVPHITAAGGDVAAGTGGGHRVRRSGTCYRIGVGSLTRSWNMIFGYLGTRVTGFESV